ncbi:MAG TPA: tetratricopeptide repeat protein [Candidatus Paceibacterota bacterium]
MKMNKEMVIVSAIALVLIGVLVGLLVWRGGGSTVLSADASQEGMATTTSGTASATPSEETHTASVHASVVSAADPLPLDARDTIVSWTVPVQGSAVTAQVQADIVSLSKKIGSGAYPDDDLYIQIAQDYELLGDEQNAYQFYLLAAKKAPTKGLAFNNLGNLFAKLGAYHTAHEAYAKAVALEPSTELYWLSYLHFLTAYERTAPTTAPVFAAAVKATDAAPDVLIARATWEEAVGNFAGAIADWQAVRPQTGSEQQAAIDTKIASLEKKQ